MHNLTLPLFCLTRRYGRAVLPVCAVVFAKTDQPHRLR
ncbi:filamentous hemagglutinin [Acetobacter orientalis]|uniref:Filamentous hemagglutinin n=1 Tax=Acetobacter orientalis TaxID=146474 RepID=A0A2Z5ZK75_9PROT|nr:filamentous hemagglutinin [Acetobacter orientalis]